MTTLNGPILVNSGTGSDSLASGLGPTTAVNSTTEGTTASYSTTTITFSGATDLSGVSAGDLLYLATDSGRRFFAIASVNDGADSLTVDDAPAGTTSGLSWAIGGKRATLEDSNTRRLFETPDMKAGWIVEIEDNQTITTPLLWNVGGDDAIGQPCLRGDDPANHRQIAISSNDAVIDCTSNNHLFRFDNLKLVCTNATRTGAKGIETGNNYFTVENCIFGDATNTLATGIDEELAIAFPIVVIRCAFVDCTSYGIEGLFLAPSRFYVEECLFSGCSVGIACDTSVVTVVNCIFDTCGTGLSHDSGNNQGRLVVRGCIFYACTSDGMDFDQGVAFIRDCVFVSNGGYAVNDTGQGIVSGDWNVFYNNTSGVYANAAAGDNDDSSSLTGVPFADGPNGDFNLNSTTGQGAVLRGKTRTFPAA